MLAQSDGVGNCIKVALGKRGCQKIETEKNGKSYLFLK